MTKRVTRLPGTEGLRPIRQSVEEPEPELPLSTEEARLREEGKMSALYCGHDRIEVTLERRVRCKKCDHFIDPVTYILGLAKQWERYKAERREAQLSIQKLRRELLILERAEKNAKARVRRVEPADLKAVRTALTAGSRAFTRTEEALDALNLQDEALRRLLWDGRMTLEAAARMLTPEARLARDEAEAG